MLIRKRLKENESRSESDQWHTYGYKKVPKPKVCGSKSDQQQKDGDQKAMNNKGMVMKK
jgi:hypothetical protein